LFDDDDDDIKMVTDKSNLGLAARKNSLNGNLHQVASYSLAYPYVVHNYNTVIEMSSKILVH
jgi:hypothetical protein